MIAELLPRYYELTGDDLGYAIVRSIVIDGHEVAVAEITGTIAVDVMEQGREGQEFRERRLVCECDFTPGVGFEVVDGEVVRINGQSGTDVVQRCLYRQAALHLIHLELRQAYLDRYRPKASGPAFDSVLGSEFALLRHTGDIILDLMDKVKHGAVIEDGSSAPFWGGYFYLQTVAAITDQFVGHMWEHAFRLAKEKLIGLEGAVVQDYLEAAASALGGVSCYTGRRLDRQGLSAG